MSLGWMILIFVVLLIAGMPVAFVMGFSASLYLFFSSQVSFLDMAPQKLFAGMDSFVLMYIPSQREPMSQSYQRVMSLCKARHVPLVGY